VPADLKVWVDTGEQPERFASVVAGTEFIGQQLCDLGPPFNDPVDKLIGQPTAY
jgi:hypothetical protein